ncbi:cytochrome P450 [Massariosphaeria phaeospora]|uniref:Cytochrome P450 n=1 Tax=Massariosphaeria phaeospora TaxID=100035 RepID=A0A7C8I3Q8_9PLEO|nr:cytochrome P450 [Massariosphaeria phaeospora]
MSFAFVPMAIVAGICAHHGVFIHGEWHLRLHTIAFGHLILFGCFYYASQRSASYNSPALLNTAIMLLAYLTTLFSSMTIYHLFFHRLVRFPGPRLAAISKFWHIHQARHSKNHEVMQAMYEQYGPYVRTGPNELTIFHPDAIEILDSTKSNTIKDEFYDLIHPLVVDVVDMMNWFAFDVMGEVLFGEDFGLLASCQSLPAVTRQHRALAMMGPILNTVWDWMDMVSFCDERMTRRMKVPGSSMYLAHWFIQEYLRTEGKDSPERRKHALSGSTVSAMVAGSDTSPASLIAIVWFLCKYPSNADKIWAELQSLGSILDPHALAKLPHLNGVVNETLRLLPPAMTGNGRFIGDQGLSIGNIFVPPNTKVTAPKFVIQRLPSAFRYADEFIPER